MNFRFDLLEYWQAVRAEPDGLSVSTAKQRLVTGGAHLPRSDASPFMATYQRE
jgi:hypothetical protein